jgi:putrescine transport system permease protein
MNARWSWFNITSVVFGFAFLYLPILLLVIYSFNESRLVTVWAGFSTKWYGELFRNQGLMDAAWVTIRVALLSASIATVLGTLAAVSLVRYTRFNGRTLFTGMVYAPLVMPEVITGLSLLLLFVSIDFGRGFWTVTLAHITFSMCFVAVVVQSRLITFDRSLEEAAQDLGCPPFQAFMKVTLPVILPAVISGWMLAFTLSLDDLVIASFTSGPGATTSADEDLFPGAPRCNPGDQCRLYAADRRRGDRRHHRLGSHQEPGSQAPARRTGGIRQSLTARAQFLGGRSR